MFAADCWLPAGERASAVRIGAVNVLTGPGTGPDFGDALCRGDRLSARLCVEWGGRCVCLGAVPAVVQTHRYVAIPCSSVRGGCRRDGARSNLEYIHAGDSRSCDVMRLQCIESVLYIAFEPIGGATRFWSDGGSLVEAQRLQTRGRSALRPPSAGPVVPSSPSGLQPNREGAVPHRYDGAVLPVRGDADARPRVIIIFESITPHTSSSASYSVQPRRLSTRRTQNFTATGS